jgi:hypothetical protein
LKNKLLPLWKDLSRWGITSLGKGFYEFCFSSLEDVKRVRSVASWNLQPGFLKLFAWTSDFNPNLQKNTTAQVWVRMFGLAQEYWRPKILFAIASSVRTPICTDAIAAKPMFDRTFGHFARVLVDMDLSQTLRYKVLVERIGFAFYVDLEYENLPPFCNHCNMVGHYLETCKWVQNYDEGSKEQKNNGKNKKEATVKYVQRKDGRSEQNKSKEVIIVENSAGKVDPKQTGPKDPLQADAAPVQGDEDTSIAGIVENGNRFTTLVEDDGDDIGNETTVVDLVGNVTNDDVVVESDKELNVEVPVAGDESDSGSQDSEFVDATQIDVVEAQGSDQELDKTQQDMQFLKESWANMAEKEDEEIRLLAELEKDPSSSGFKIVASKSSRKEKARLARKTTSNYDTRSKVSVTKPSK